MKELIQVFFQWFGHIERMENDRTAKRVYVGESMVSRSTMEEVD